MAKKPTYEELEKMIKALEKETADRVQAEDALRKSKERYELATTAGRVGVWDWNIETNEIYIDSSLKAMLGYKDHEIQNHLDDWGKLVHADDREQVMAEAKAHLGGLTPQYKIEHRMLHKDGTVYWFLARGTAFRDVNGKPYRMLGTDTDITERKILEETLRYRVEFENLITTISTGFISLSTDEIDNGINRALKEIGEFSNADRSYVFLFSEDGTKMDNTHEWCAEGIEPQIDNLKGLPVEASPWWQERLNRLENIYIPCVADLPSEAHTEKKTLQSQDIQSLIVVPMACGKSLMGFLGFDSVREEKTWPEDIIALLRIAGNAISNAVERKQAEERVRLLSSAAEQSSEGMAVSDLEGHLLFTNRAFAAMHGYTQDELLGEHVSIFHTSEQMPSVEAANRQTQKTGEFSGEIWHVQRAGTVFPALMHNSLLRDETGKPIGMIGTLRDITEHKRAEKALQKAHDELEQRVEQRTAELVKSNEQLARANRLASLGQLSGGIAHEIRNPLSSASLFVDTLSDQKRFDRTDKELEILGDIKNDLNKIAGIIKRILEFAKPSIGSKSKIDMNALILETLELWSAGIIRSRIRLELSLGKEIPTVVGDPIELQQVANNLLSNAMDAMEKGGTLSVTVSKGMSSFQEGREVVIVSVRDTGPGIETEVTESIFNPFFTTKTTGTGLGLAISHQIIERHGGTISIESKPDEGTIFTVELPCNGKNG